MIFRSLGAALLLATGLLLPTRTHAQGAARINTVSSHAWYQYFGTYRFTSRWSASTEVQVRRASLLSDKQQLLTRAALNYTLTDRVMFTVGYGYIHTYPYGEYPSAAAFPEQRIYQQAQLTAAPLGRLVLAHRYRQEQRFLRFPGLTDYQLLNRSRYQLRATLPLTQATVEPKTLYAYAFDEVFVSFGKNVATNIFDQNRLGGGLGYKLSKALAVEVGYLQQLVAQRNGRIFEYNHTLTVALAANLDLRRAEAPAAAPPAAQ